jgi:hypothetical protein
MSGERKVICEDKTALQCITALRIEDDKQCMNRDLDARRPKVALLTMWPRARASSA